MLTWQLWRGNAHLLGQLATMLLCQASLGSKLQLLQLEYFLIFYLDWPAGSSRMKAAPSNRYTLGAVNVRLGQPPGERIQ